MDRRDTLLALILISIAVPLQYWLVPYEGNQGGSWSDKSLLSLGRSTIRTVNEWLEWLDDLASDMEIDSENENSEDGVRMVVGLKDNTGKLLNGTAEEEYFATSTKPRRRRPKEVLYRVGQVVFHRKLETRGVVMGWDSEAKAPLTWLKQVYGNSESEIFLEPHYTVICDTKELPGVENEVHYFAQSQLDDDTSSAVVNNPLLVQLFKGFDKDTGRYVMSSSLKKLYPRD